MAEDTEQRVATLERTVAEMWRRIDDIYGKFGQKSPRWTYDGPRDMAEHMRRRLAS